MYQVFFNDNRLILSDNLLNSANNIEYADYQQFKFIFETLENNNNLTINLYNSDLEILWNDFKDNLNCIEAAGGVVRNKKDEILFIRRLGKWDLPKGKIEKGEKIEEAALREVEEECGISKLKITQRLINTYHIYFFKEKYNLKITNWFAMDYSGKESLKPQIEEDISDVRWIKKENAQKILDDSYENVKLLMEYYLK